MSAQTGQWGRATRAPACERVTALRRLPSTPQYTPTRTATYQGSRLCFRDRLCEALTLSLPFLNIQLAYLAMAGLLMRLSPRARDTHQGEHVHTRVLVVDDEPDLLELIDYNLTKAGYDVAGACSGKRR